MNSKNPNIIYILADDMGYGDVSSLSDRCVWKTPSIDRLAREGIAFTDAHSSSAVCTPSRYSILTGRYCWRTYLKQGVNGGASGPLIEKGRTTIASLLKDAGYNTACIGKWHVGWNWAVKEGMEEKVNRGAWAGETMDWIDYKKPVTEGPVDVGFDYFYGISGSLDMPPYVYVENNMPVEEPTSWGTTHEFLRQGPRMERLRANNVLGHLTNKAVDYIEEQNSDSPFFLYFPLTAPHTPISPAPEFDGKSGINPYADFVLEVDARVGQVLDAVDKKGFGENTLIIFTTDNGASYSPSECAILEERFGHYCSHIYRGYKADIWDGGHRLPFVMKWPKVIKPGSTCNEPVGIFDVMATAAEITRQTIPDSAAEDSLSFLTALKGEQLDSFKRKALINHSIGGLFAIRQGKWKLCRCAGSGGWAEPTEKTARLASLPEIQLYDLENDPGERDNLALERGDIVDEMTKLLHRCVMSGNTINGKKSNPPAEEELGKWEQLNWLPEIPAQFVIDD